MGSAVWESSCFSQPIFGNARSQTNLLPRGHSNSTSNVQHRTPLCNFTPRIAQPWLIGCLKNTISMALSFTGAAARPPQDIYCRAQGPGGLKSQVWDRGPTKELLCFGGQATSDEDEDEEHLAEAVGMAVEAQLCFLLFWEWISRPPTPQTLDPRTLKWSCRLQQSLAPRSTR